MPRRLNRTELELLLYFTKGAEDLSLQLRTQPVNNQLVLTNLIRLSYHINLIKLMIPKGSIDKFSLSCIDMTEELCRAFDQGHLVEETDWETI